MSQSITDFYYKDRFNVIDGIHRSVDDVEAVSFPEDGYDLCFQIEDNSFWFQHRNRCISKVVNSKSSDQNWFFDVGGGNGVVSKCLKEQGYAVAIVEPGEGGVFNAKKRGLEHVFHCELNEQNFRPNSIPMLGAFDVIEHIEDDQQFVALLHRMIQPGGQLFATVPAFNILWSEHDTDAGHFRRYSRGQFLTLLRKSGFEIEYSSYFFCLLLPIIALLRCIPYRLGIQRKATEKPAQDHRPGLLSKLLLTLLRLELPFLGLGLIPLGGSILVVARKPEASPAE